MKELACLKNDMNLTGLYRDLSITAADYKH